jgi:hypothetical protein
MKIINKSGRDINPDTVEEFYILLDKAMDKWEGGWFACEEGRKWRTEDEAASTATEGQVIAKVTLVAKIV